MAVLKSLTFTTIPTQGGDPILDRRAKVIARLEEQKLELKLLGQITHMLPPMWSDLPLTHLLLPKRPLHQIANFLTVKFDIRQSAEDNTSPVYSERSLFSLKSGSSQSTASPRLPTVSDGFPTCNTAQSPTAKHA